MTDQSAISEWVSSVFACKSSEGTPINVSALNERGGPWLVKCNCVDDGQESSAVLRVADQGRVAGKGDGYVRTEAAALRVAELHDVPAPRLLGLADAGSVGVTASLQSVLDGEPIVRGSYDGRRLRTMGQLLAVLHRVRAEPEPDLPRRSQALEPGGGFTEERRESAGSPRWNSGEKLLENARQRISRQAPSSTRAGLVHGDAWMGNAMATGRECVGFVDWGCAGIGHPGVDVGYARLSAALTFGAAAAAELLTGWETEEGAELESLAYWDIVAALTTPPVIGSATDARDQFLEDALSRLERTAPMGGGVR